MAARLMPDTLIGCKRLCVDTGYYATFNRDDVELVDVSATPIERGHPDRGAGGRTATSTSTCWCSPPGSTP